MVESMMPVTVKTPPTIAHTPCKQQHLNSLRRTNRAPSPARIEALNPKQPSPARIEALNPKQPLPHESFAARILRRTNRATGVHAKNLAGVA